MKHSALLVIDVQKGMFREENPVFNGFELLNHLNALIKNARANQVPVIFIQHDAGRGKPLEHGTTGWEIHDALLRKHDDMIIEKKTPDSFYGTSLDETLQRLNVKHLVISGIQSEVCVDTTTRSAFSKEYEVTLVTDAHSTWSSNELTATQIIHHHNQVLRWFAETKPTAEIHFGA